MEIINYISWPAYLTYEEAYEQKDLIYHKNISEMCYNLSIKNKSHIKAVCEGTRSNVDSYRLAKYDAEKNCPILHETHNKQCKKIVRKVICLNDNKIFDNFSKAAKEYSVHPNQILLCAKGKIKSVFVKNKETDKKERFRFAFLDKSNKPILTNKHKEPLEQRKGISRIFLIYPRPDGQNEFSSLAEYCRKTGVPPKRARKYLTDRSINLLGLEFITIE